MHLEALRTHLEEHALQTGGEFRLRSGAVSDWYLDARMTTYDGPGAIVVGRAVLEVLVPDATAVGGMTMGADPIAVATAVIAAMEGQVIKAFSVRKEAKEHGIGGRLVGPVVPGDRAAVVEDTTTTGGALLEAIEVITAAGIEVVQALALVDRSAGVVARLCSERGIAYRALVLPEDLGVTT
jgi:orotate phosphoribosyltransferase